MLDAIQNFTESLPTFLQWLGIIVAGAVPFIESYLGSVLGVVVGLHPVVAVAAASVGNFLSVMLVVLITGKARDRVVRDQVPKPSKPKRQRLRNAFDKWGVPGVSLVGPTIVASQITSAALISFGAPRRQVLIWQAISIVVWGTVFGILAALGLTAIQG